jgi:hypothetical protein
MLYMCALPGDLPAQTDTGSGRSGSISGTYTANGVNPSGGEFSGTAIVSDLTDPDVYSLQLIITGGILQGRAVRSGDRLEVMWESVAAAADDRLTGTGDYRIGADGVITGTWRVDGSEVDGTIELFPDP